MDWINNAGALAGSISAIIALIAALLFKPLKRMRAARRQDHDAAAEFRRTVLAKLDAINDDVADLQYERLSQAHDFYVGRGWCPTSKKNQLCQMYKSYTAKGRNHLSKYYEQEILALAEEPQERSEST
ncbi:MAG TPA: hypothetical protein IAB50_12185 [Candidatus Faecivicinus avistercoris]|nr:hypothetical protein [Candidatus Faecivicinus avistercoris]